MSKTWDSTLSDSLAQPGKKHWTVRVVALAGQPIDANAERLEARTPVGRAVPPSGGIALPDPRVSRHHATIELQRGGVRIVPEGDAKVMLEGRPIEHEGCRIQDGDAVVLGASVLVFRQRDDALAEPEDDTSKEILGDAPSIRAIRRSVRLIGPTPATVLLLGESGTGKEVVARALHHASRRKGPLVSVNASAIPATLAESHLFGHVAGAFTGATSAGLGVFRAAEGGTLFFDELADLPPELQPKLLRVLEERVVVPVGSTKGLPVDVRIVCATNKPLLAEVDAGRFRGDLYARVSDFTLELPPLRERREDVLTLLRRDLGDDAPPLSAELLVELTSRPYRFNVRELKKLAMQLKVRGGGAAKLTLDMIDVEESKPSIEPAAAEAHVARVPTREELEALLEKHGGVLEFVAQETGRSRRQVHRWLDKHGIELERFRRP